MKGQTYSLRDLAGEFGIHHSTLSAALKRCGHKIGKSDKFSVRQAYDALTKKADSKGTMQEERLLKLRAERMLAEKEVEEKEGTLIHIDDAKTMCRNLFVPVRQRLDSLPTEACGKANPSDPKHAYAVLRQWSDDSLAMLREGLPPVRKE